MRARRGTIEAMDVIDPYPPVVPPGQDALPYEDGEPMESKRHRSQMEVLLGSLEDAWDARDDFFVGGNMFVYFSEPQTRGAKFRGPDVFVVLDTDRQKVRKSWVAWEENGKLPDVVIELLSPSTEAIDRGEKMRVYERVWCTGHYVLFDVDDGRLEGFRLVGGRYESIAPDERGDLLIGSMGLALGAREARHRGEGGVWLRWIEPSGEMVPTAEETARGLKKRVAELEAKLRGDD